jgi:hypothetical protein
VVECAKADECREGCAKAERKRGRGVVECAKEERKRGKGIHRRRQRVLKER